MDKEKILQATDFAALFAEELPGFRLDRKDGEAWALCPFHADRNPDNFHTTDVSSGAWYCHVCKRGWDGIAVMGKVWGTDFKETLQRIAARAGIDTTPKKKPRRIVAAYDYTDESGNILFQAVRFEPKGFSQRRPDGKGGWIWNLQGVRLVPYRLPEIVAEGTDHVFIVEGEKDVDNLRALGLVATCNPMGAGKWVDSFSKHLEGKRVTILPDNDQAGRDHARAVARSIYGTASRVEIVELPDLPPKGDVSDWLGGNNVR